MNFSHSSQIHKKVALDLFLNHCLAHPNFCFWVLVTFDAKVMKILKYYVIFVYILQDKLSKTGKNRKRIIQLKWPKYQKPKDENMGWMKQMCKFSFMKLFQIFWNTWWKTSYFCALLCNCLDCAYFQIFQLVLLYPLKWSDYQCVN